MENWVSNGRRRRGAHAGMRLRAACVLFALLCACAGQKKTRGPVLLHPAPPTAKEYALVQGAIVYSGAGFTVSARPWDYRLVAEEIARAGEPSPFGQGEEGAGRYLFVRVRLENRSTRTLVFNPMRAFLARAGETPIPPVENADLVAFADEEIAAAETRARTFRRLSFDLTATVPAGGALERYLVFPAPERLAGALELRLDDLWLGASSFDVRFPFEAFPGSAPDPTPDRALPPAGAPAGGAAP